TLQPHNHAHTWPIGYDRNRSDQQPTAATRHGTDGRGDASLNRTTEDSYTSSLAVEPFLFGLSVAQRSRRLPNPRLACSSTSPLARLCSERTAGVFSKSFILYQC